MAAPAANSVAALAATSFGGGDNTPSSCVDDPNFATICSFIQNFGEIIRIGRIPFDDLQQMLENSADVPPPLAQLHITLLRRVFKTVTPDKWERSLAKFGHTYCSQDAWEIERFGYKKAKIQTKLRLLKNLLEAQFDYNVKFKAEVNKLQASDLRLNPLGRDTEGQVYWYQVDEDANLRVYREDIDDETWEIVASNRDELEELISQLQRGEVKKPEPEETIIVPEEDSNSKDDIEPKEIILDTGKVEDDASGSNVEVSSESDECDDNKEKRTVEPLIIKHSFNIHKVHTPSEVENVKSDVDKVQNEVSSESEPKVPGIKLVFGVKSAANSENFQPNPDASQIDIKKPTEDTTTSSGLAEPISSAKWSICTSTAPPQTDIVPKSEPSEKTTKDNADECKVTKSETLEVTSKQIQEEVPVFTFDSKDSNKNATLRNELSLSTSFQARELLTKVNKNRQRHLKVNSTSTTPPQTDVVPKSELSETTTISNVDEVKVVKSDTLEITPTQVEKLAPTRKQVEKLVPTPKQVEKLVPTPKQVEKLVPTPKQVEKSVPTPKQAETILPTPPQVEKVVPAPKQIETVRQTPPQVEKVVSTSPLIYNAAPPSPLIEKAASIQKQIEKEIPTARHIEKEVRSARQTEKEVPTARKIEKEVPTVRQIEKEVPTARKIEKEVPTVRQIEKEVPTARKIEKEVPTVRQIEKEVPTVRQIEKEAPTAKQNETALQTPPQMEEKIVPIQKQFLTDSPIDTKKNVIFSNELSTSVHQRELQTKANKIRQKSAKVNSIVERLNKKLPENYAKTVADLIPPPNITKSEADSAQQKQNPVNIPTVQKSEATISPSKDNKLSVTQDSDKLPVSQDVSVDIESVKIVQSNAMDLTRTSMAPYESSIKKRASSKNETVSFEVEKVSKPIVETQSNSNIRNPKLETAKEFITSISSEPLAINQNIITKESSAIKKEPTVLNISEVSSDSNETSNIIPKDNGNELRVGDSSVVPEKKVTDATIVQPMVIVEEEIIEKKEAWICGTQEIPVKEKPAIKESTWVCGDPVNSATNNDDVKLDWKEKEKLLSLTETHVNKEIVFSKPPVKTASDLTTHPCSETLHIVTEESLPSSSDLMKETTHSSAKDKVITVPCPATESVNSDKKTKKGPSAMPVIGNKSFASTPGIQTAPEGIKSSTLQVDEKESTFVNKSKEIELPSNPQCQPIVSSSIVEIGQEEAKPSKTTVEIEPLTVKESDERNLEKESNVTPKNMLVQGTIQATLSTKKISGENGQPAKVENDIVETQYSEALDIPTVYKRDKEITLDISNSTLPTTVAHTITNVNKTNSETSQCLTAVSDCVKNTVASPNRTVSDGTSLISTPKENQIDDTSTLEVKDAGVESNNSKREDDQKKKIVEKPSVSAKVNSALVLYSESSESSNEAFALDTSSNKITTSSVSEKFEIKITENISNDVSGNKADSSAGSNNSSCTNNTLNEEEKEDPEQGSRSDINSNASDSTKSEMDKKLAQSKESVKGASAINPSSDKFNNVNDKPIEAIKATPKENPEMSTSEKALLPKEVPTAIADTTSTSSSACKRKAETYAESLAKVRKLEDIPSPLQLEANSNIAESSLNPIVGDTVEEEVMTITGEGSGAMNEGRNSPVPFNPICGETIEEEVMTITGLGFGVLNEGSNENSPVSLAVTDVTGSQNESIESDESRDAFVTARGRGGRRGRGRRGRPPVAASGGRSSQPSSVPRTSNRGSRGSREVARLGVSLDSIEVNGENERPVRASRRIAQIRLKEEEERRKLEEERLAQLKAAQIQKKAKQEEKDKNKEDGQSPAVKVKKGAGRKSQKEQLQSANYVPSGTESEEDNSEDEEEGSDEFSGKLGKKQRRRRKNGKAKKGGNPWATSDEDEEEEQVEEEEEYHYEEEEEEELIFKSDHEFSPESDMENDGDVGPSRHARTAKQDKGDLFEEGNCCKCGKGDHPEWILLCDKCDKGWHASCLRPQLWVIPEGEWFCPPCQHNMLIENLSKNLVEYESLLKKRENEILRKQRLAYVGISLDNVLPDKEPEVPQRDEEEHDEKVEREKRRQRRRILSDEELSDDFINDSDSDGDLSRSRSGSSDDSDEPVYRLRARRTKKAFDFKEYDDMINSALRVDDDEDVGEAEKADLDDEEEEEEEDDEDKKLNGDDKSDHGGGVGGGKNDAFLKQLEKQAQEEDETDEELLDEKERLRRKELKKQGQRKARRRINDLDAYSDEEDSDDDFKASEAEDDEEELAEDGESEWSGDKMEEDSDDSIAKRARRKDRQGRHRRLGRREKYSDKGLVRRSTRKRRSRISYDESDDDDEEEEDQNDKWQSDESEEEEEESESNSESDDATWGKRKKKGFGAAKPKLASFVLGASSSTKGKGKGGVKRKKRRTDEDDVDRAWNSARSKKDKEEPIERRTRGRKINFKDILDSGESDDDGNIRPKRRPLSDSEDSRSPSSSRRLAEEIRAENARRDKEYEENKAKMASATSFAGVIDQTKLEETATTKEIIKSVASPPVMPESLTVAKLAESSVNKITVPSSVPKISPSPTPVQQLSAHPSPTHAVSPLPVILPPIASPLPAISSPLPLPPNSSPLHLSTSTPPQRSPSDVANTSSNIKQSDALSSVLPKSPPPPPVSFIPKSVSLNLTVGPISSSVSGGGHIPQNISLGHIPPGLLSGSLPVNPSAGSIPPNLSVGPIPSNLSTGTVPPILSAGSLHKSNLSSIPPPVPVPILTEKKSKQSKGSRGSRGTKPEKQLPPPPPVSSPSGLELALTKPVKTSPLGPTISKSSTKRKDRERESSLSVPNPSLLMAGAGGVLPELLGAGLSSSLRAAVSGSAVSPSSTSSSKKGKSSSSRTTQQTTPPPVSQNLSPSLPIDIDRVPNPALFQGNPGLRPFHPMWARGPPPPGYSPSGSLGKPPPLNTSPFSGQQGPPPRSGFSSPPPLRIPNPNTSPLQAFQHFKRDGPLGGPLYRLAPGQPQPGGPLSSILPPGMMSPHAGGAERFFGAPSGYPHPYGLLPPHSQGPPQALFPYDYRAPEPTFKDEPTPPRTTSSSLPTPVSSASSSPPPTTSASVPLPTKDEGSAARDSEFGGLVSYFSSQRSEEDMDT